MRTFSLETLPSEATPSEKSQRLAQLRQQIAQRETPRDDEEKARIPSGIELLDQAIGGGLIPGALNEFFMTRGTGLLAQMLPSMLGVPREKANSDQVLAWVAPQPPYPPALAQLGVSLERCLIIPCQDIIDRLWTLEQITRSGLCDLVISEIETASLEGEDRLLRRLQLGAAENNTPVILLRPLSEIARASPAPIRLKFTPRPSSHPRRYRAHIEVLRSRRSSSPSPLPPSLLVEWNVDSLAEPLHAELCHRASHPRRSRHGQSTSRSYGA